MVYNPLRSLQHTKIYIHIMILKTKYVILIKLRFSTLHLGLETHFKTTCMGLFVTFCIYAYTKETL